jgi:hypothetical protein
LIEPLFDGGAGTIEELVADLRTHDVTPGTLANTRDRIAGLLRRRS